jgi:hypothetical protein
MAEFIISAIALLIVIPALYILPFNLTNKGKYIIGLFSYLIASLGIFSTFIYTYETTILLLFLLTIIIAYFLSFLPAIFNNSVISKKFIHTTIDEQVKENIYKVSKTLTDIKEKNTFVDKNEIPENIINQNNENKIEFTDEIPSIVEDITLDSVTEVYQQIDIVQNDESDDDDDDISFLINRSDIETIEDIEVKIDSIKPITYMSEIELLLEGDDYFEFDLTSSNDHDQDNLETQKTEEDKKIDLVIEEESIVPIDLWEEITIDYDEKNNKNINL